MSNLPKGMKDKTNLRNYANNNRRSQVVAPREEPHVEYGGKLNQMMNVKKTRNGLESI